MEAKASFPKDWVLTFLFGYMKTIKAWQSSVSEIVPPDDDTECCCLWNILNHKSYSCLVTPQWCWYQNHWQWMPVTHFQISIYIPISILRNNKSIILFILCQTESLSCAAYSLQKWLLADARRRTWNSSGVIQYRY